ncbi:MAG: hypothetical protein KDK70_16425 [Myxococcales bacterium]|nr:hypothetical protein [Myxococcales bacterium]
MASVDRGIEGRLTLLRAPAGAGKSALLCAWRRTTPTPTAWLSLEAADDHPARWLAHVLAALGTVDPSLGAEAEGVGGISVEQLEDLLAELVVIPLLGRSEPLALVLDDAHHLEDARIHAAMTWLLEHMPPCLRLLVSTRRPPPWPLARLRVHGELTTLDADDLRLSLDEAGAFYRDVMLLRVSDEQIALLHEHTRGWAAGIQLIGLGLERGASPEALLRHAPASSHDFLLNEVLSMLDPDLVGFLLRTSVLERFDASLADAVVAGEAMPAARAIRELVDQQLFIEPLDDEQAWHRLHPLLHEALRARLQEEDPTLHTRLHRRACAWWSEANEPRPAVAHAIASADQDLIVGEVLRWGGPVATTGDMDALCDWLVAIEPERVATTPLLSILGAWTALYRGQLQGVVEALADAKRALAALEATDPLRLQLSGFVGSLEAALALREGRPQEALQQLEGLLAAMPERHQGRATMALSAADALIRLGDHAEALAQLERAEQDGLADANTNITVTARARMAEIHAAKGAWSRAQRHASSALTYAVRNGCAHLPPAGLARIQLATIALGEGDLDEAIEQTEAAMLCLGSASDQEDRALGYELLTRIALARGRPLDARRVVDDARRELGDSGFMVVRHALERIASMLDEPPASRPPAPLPGGSSELPPPVREPLTERELEVLSLVAEGLSNREVARRLCVSAATVKTHLYNGYGKLGVRSRTKAVHVARLHGLLATFGGTGVAGSNGASGPMEGGRSSR